MPCGNGKSIPEISLDRLRQAIVQAVLGYFDPYVDGISVEQPEAAEIARSVIEIAPRQTIPGPSD